MLLLFVFDEAGLTRSRSSCPQVERLLQPDLFNRPAAVLAVAIAGSNIGACAAPSVV